MGSPLPSSTHDIVRPTTGTRRLAIRFGCLIRAPPPAEPRGRCPWIRDGRPECSRSSRSPGEVRLLHHHAFGSSGPLLLSRRGDLLLPPSPGCSPPSRGTTRPFTTSPPPP